MHELSVYTPQYLLSNTDHLRYIIINMHACILAFHGGIALEPCYRWYENENCCVSSENRTIHFIGRI